MATPVGVRVTGLRLNYGRQTVVWIGRVRFEVVTPTRRFFETFDIRQPDFAQSNIFVEQCATQLSVTYSVPVLGF